MHFQMYIINYNSQKNMQIFVCACTVALILFLNIRAFFYSDKTLKASKNLTNFNFLDLHLEKINHKQQYPFESNTM